MKTLVLINKDETLINVRTEHITDSRIHEVVRRAQSQGIQIGLHSDSPLQSLVDVQFQLGMDGPTIAELGTVISLCLRSSPIYVLDEETRGLLQSLRYDLLDFAKIHSIEVWLGDVVENRLSARFGTPDRRVIGINARRQSSCLGFSWRTKEDGSLSPDVELLRQIDAWVKSRPEANQLQVMTNLEHGVFAVHAVMASKRLGTDYLRIQWPDIKIIMIGNALIDYCGEGIVHAAVGNADTEFKERADYVSSAPHTAGVVDILECILRGEL